MTETNDERMNQDYTDFLQGTVVLITGYAMAQETIKQALQEQLTEKMGPAITAILMNRNRTDKELRDIAVALSPADQESAEAQDFIRRWNRVNKARDTIAHGVLNLPMFSNEDGEVFSQPIYKGKLSQPITLSELEALGRVSYIRSQTRIAANTTPARYVTASLS